MNKNSEDQFHLPPSLEAVIFPDNKPSEFLSPDIVFKELNLEDQTLKLCLKQIISIILRCQSPVDISINVQTDMLIEITQGLGNLDVLRDLYVWEHLNVGHWKSVSSVWRKTYTYISILKVILLLLKGEQYTDIIRQCDLGLLMGEPILMGDILHRLADELSVIIISSNNSVMNEMRDLKAKNNNDSDKRMQNEMLANQCEELKFDITYADNPSLEYFSFYMEREIPIIVTKGIEHWPARQKWNVEYVRKVAGFRTVPVEIGPKYTSEEWTQKLMSINEFIERYMNDHMKKDKNDFGYIAQHHLFDQITELKRDIKTPDYCSLGKNNHVDVNAWFGPANTISPTHYDPKHNLLVQIFGTKIVRLYPPSENLYPYPATSLLFNTSQLDLEDARLFETHPDIKNAKYCEFLLKPGMILYIPPKWWHYIKSLTPCFSVSYWYD